MFLLPYEHFIIDTNLRADEAARKLKSVIEPKRYLRLWSARHKPYEGKVAIDRFSANRIISYRNSFLPMIHGEIIPDLNGCAIEITMRLHYAVLAFLVLWFGGAGYGFLTGAWPVVNSLFGAGNEQPIHPEMLIMPGIIIAFAYTITVGAFKIEAGIAERFFRKLFQENTVEVEQYGQEWDRG